LTNRMKVLVLTPSLYNTSPGSRFRIEQWAPHLARDGFQFSFVPFEDEAMHRVIHQPGQYVRKSVLTLRALGRRLRVLPLAREHDVVFVYEEASRVGPPVIERLVNQLGRPIIYDFSDPIWLPYVSLHSPRVSYLKSPYKIASICRLSTVILAGNRFLADYARQHNPRVTIVPDTVDTERYRVKDANRRPSDDIVVGWSGSATTGRHLEMIAGALGKLSQRVRFRLKILGNVPPRLSDVPHDFVQWRPENEVDELRSFDIGIMPLPDDPYTRYRTHLKIRQYMAVGIPSVASPVGIMPEIVDDGVNGFLAGSDEGWIEKLALLIAKPELREQMGLEARRKAETCFSTQVWLPKIRHVFESASRLESSPHS